MQKVEYYLLCECIESLKDVWEGMRATTIDKLREKADSGKKDSLYLDTLPEYIIHNRLEEYDRHIVLVTEEKGKFNYEEINEAEVVVFSDPTDRSKYFQKFLEEFALDKGVRNLKLGRVLDSKETVGKWSEFVGVPAVLSGACCSITVVKRGRVLFSLILNYITQELFVACDELVGRHSMRKTMLTHGTCTYSNWAKITFPKPKKKKTTSYVAFLGKNYKERLDESHLLGESFSPQEEEPGGPARILYLSNMSQNPAGFILANGEKIGEWINWLAFCKYSCELVAYSVYPGTFFAKDDVLMAPSPLYSILEVKDDVLCLNYDKLKYFENPSRYREMILICHKSNNLIRPIIESNRSRRLPM